MSKISVFLREEDSILYPYFKNELKKNFHLIGRSAKISDIFPLLKKSIPDIVMIEISHKIETAEIEMINRIQKEHPALVLFINKQLDNGILTGVTITQPHIQMIKPFDINAFNDAIQAALTHHHKTKGEIRAIKDINNYLANELKKHTNVNKEVVILNNSFIYNKKEKSLYYNLLPVSLSKKETLLFDLLIQNIGKTVTHDMIDFYIWPDGEVPLSTIRSLIRRIRNKLVENIIINVAGIGYKINLPN